MGVRLDLGEMRLLDRTRSHGIWGNNKGGFLLWGKKIHVSLLAPLEWLSVYGSSFFHLSVYSRNLNSFATIQGWL